MRIQLLGTAASEGIPGVFCDCAVCKECRSLGGKNLRSRQQTIIDEGVLIDFPADTIMHSYVHGLNLSKVHTCLVTHSHGDHFCPTEFFIRGASFMELIEERMTIYGTEAVLSKIEKTIANPEKSRIAGVLIDTLFEPFEVRGYRVTPLAADHDYATCGSVLYLIEKDGKAYLHGTDTAYFPEETWSFLEKAGVHLDAVVLDATFFTWNHLTKTGVDGLSYGHMSMFCCAQVKERLEEIGIADQRTKVVLTHMAHCAASTHDEMQRQADEYGLIVGYDGMVIDI